MQARDGAGIGAIVVRVATGADWTLRAAPDGWLVADLSVHRDAALDRHERVGEAADRVGGLRELLEHLVLLHVEPQEGALLVRFEGRVKPGG